MQSVISKELIMKKKLFVEKVYQLVKKDVLQDQSALVQNALDTGLFRYENIQNSKRFYKKDSFDLDGINAILLVTPDLAYKLTHLLELVLSNDCGNWWFTSLKKDQPLWDHDILYKIAIGNK